MNLMQRIVRVDVWYASLPDQPNAQQWAGWRKVLTRQELELEESYHLPSVKVQYLASRALVRSVLSIYLESAPEKIPFTLGKHGKPYLLSESPNCYFNVSHTHGLVVCAVARHGEVGIDIELCDRPVNLKLAPRYFAPEEVDQLEQLPESLRPSRFLEFWTLKEAFIKATGHGLAMPLDRFAFDLSGLEPRLMYCYDAGSPADWLIARSCLFDRYLLAVVTESRDYDQVVLHFHDAASALAPSLD
jgi:4'-phosphopantetheinyl transferase